MKKILLVLSALLMASAIGQNLRTQVEALPATNASEKIKKAVLLLALERADYAQKANLTEQAQKLLADVQTSLAQDAAKMAAPATAKNISALFPLRTVEKNPYLDRLVIGARWAIAKPDVAWPINTPENSVFAAVNAPNNAKDYDPRLVALQMESYLWLFAHPQSPLRHDPEILTRFLRRAHAYAEAMATLDNQKGGKGIFDDFAICPASCALREFAQLHPGLLLPSEKAFWDLGMRKGAQVVMTNLERHLAAHPKGYANIDVCLSYELLNFGLYLNDEQLLARAREIFYRLEKSILPDGGTNYIWSQNESSGYHDVVAQYFAKTYEITQDPKALEFLQRLEWYGPVSTGKLGEYWTAPSWKHTWNSSMRKMVGGEFVAAVTGNPYVHGLLGEPEFDPKDLRRWYDARPALPWYRNDITSKPIPDKVTYLDRNISGPRAWYERFSYAATLRDIPIDEPGHATLMGAMVTEPDFTMQAFLMGVFPKVRIGAQKDKADAWAQRTHDLKSALVLGRDFSAFVATYGLETWRSASKGKVADWQAQQVWLGLPDRIIGLVKVLPVGDQASAHEIAGIIRLGTGGTVNGKPQKIQELSPGEFQYGDFVARVHQHTYEKMTAEVVPFRLPAFPVTEITLHQEASSPAATGYQFLVEIRPAWVATKAEIKLIPNAPGLASFSVKVGEKEYQVLANPTAQELSLPTPPANEKTTLHRTPKTGTSPAKTWPSSLTLAANQIALFVTSPDAIDHLAGWPTYQEMLRDLTTK